MFESDNDDWVRSSTGKFKTYAIVFIVVGLAYFAVDAVRDQAPRNRNSERHHTDGQTETDDSSVTVSAPPKTDAGPQTSGTTRTHESPTHDPPHAQDTSEPSQNTRAKPTPTPDVTSAQEPTSPTTPRPTAESSAPAPSVAKQPALPQPSPEANKTLPPRVAREITDLRQQLHELGEALDELQVLTGRIENGQHPEIEDFGHRLAASPAFGLYKEYQRRKEARTSPQWNRKHLERQRMEALSRLDEAERTSERPDVDAIRRFLTTDAAPVLKRRNFLRKIVDEAESVLAPSEKWTAAERYDKEQETVEEFIQSGPLQPFLGTEGKATYWWLYWSRLAAGVDPDTGRLGPEQSEDYLLFHLFIDNMAETAPSLNASRYRVTARRTYDLWRTFRLVVDYRPDVFKRVVKWSRPHGMPFRDRFPLRVRRPNGIIEDPPQYLLGRPSPPSTARRRVMAVYRSQRYEVQRRFFPQELP